MPARYARRACQREPARPKRGDGMKSLAEILGAKGGEVLEIDADATVFDAVRTMVEMNVGSLLVTEGGEITGIVTERDYLGRVTLEGRTEDAPVRDIMSSPSVVAAAETTVDECMALMTDRRIRHVPVVEGDRVVGLVSIGDLVKCKSEE